MISSAQTIREGETLGFRVLVDAENTLVQSFVHASLNGALTLFQCSPVQNAAICFRLGGAVLVKRPSSEMYAALMSLGLVWFAPSSSNIGMV